MLIFVHTMKKLSYKSHKYEKFVRLKSVTTTKFILHSDVTGRANPHKPWQGQLVQRYTPTGYLQNTIWKCCCCWCRSCMFSKYLLQSVFYKTGGVTNYITNTVKVWPLARQRLLTWPPCCLIRACVVFWCWITLRSLSTNAAWSLGMNPRYARFSDVYSSIKTFMSHVCGEGTLVKWTHPACNKSFTSAYIVK